jgi:ankyrin repeat protein
MVTIQMLWQDELLLRYGADVSRRDREGNMALSIAAARHDKALEKILKKAVTSKH